MSDEVPKIAVFLSGNGSNLQALIDAGKSKILSGRAVLVVSSNNKAYGLERARKNDIETFVFRSKDYKSNEQAEKTLCDKLNEFQIDFIVLAGYLKVVPPRVVSKFENRIVNIHPALLPKYGGKGMYGINVHKAVIESGDGESGLTIHFVDEVYDNGRILEQVKVPVKEDDTPESLAKRILEQEHKIYPRVIEKLIKGRFDDN